MQNAKKAQIEKIVNIDENPELEKEEFSFKALVRPGSVVVMLLFFIFVVLSDGNIPNFNIKKGYYPMIETVVTTVIVAFFGMRGIEKTAREWQRYDYRSSYTRNRRRFNRYSEEEEYPKFEEDYSSNFGGYRSNRYKDQGRYNYDEDI